MILSNPYPMTHDGVEYPVTPIMKKWYENKTSLRLVQSLQSCYLVGDGLYTQRVEKDMVSGSIEP